MKALIWIGCIFVASFVQTLLRYAGIGGALPTIAVYGLMFALARYFCKLYEKKQSKVPTESDTSKQIGIQNFDAGQEDRIIAEDSAACDHSETERERTPIAEGAIATSTIPLDAEAAGSKSVSDIEPSQDVLSEIEETELPSRDIQEEVLNMESAVQETEQIGDQTVQQAEQQGKQSGEKKRYCKRCGALVDQETKKCTSCGKQYLHVTKHLWIALFAIICCALAGLNILQYTQRVSIEKELKQATATISARAKTVSNQKETISKQRTEISDLKEDVNRYRTWWAESFGKAEFMDNYVVIVGDSNNKYHKYGCEDLDLSQFYAFNVENARAQGYRACSKCN